MSIAPVQVRVCDGENFRINACERRAFISILNNFLLIFKKFLYTYRFSSTMTLFLQDPEDARILPCIDLPPEKAKAIASPLATRVMRTLAQHADGMHASEIARRLREPVQKIHYHVTRLRKAGIVRVERLADTSGASAKILRVNAPAVGVRFGEFQQGAGGGQRDSAFLSPFITDGEWNARIVVGSPDPHGPESARGRDAAYAIDLGLFFGARTRIAPGPAVTLDTELRSWRANLVIIGGPVVNKAAARINDRRDAAVSYDAGRKAFRTPAGWFDSETGGVIVKMPNPFAPGKQVLWIAGKRHTGTRAAILAFLRDFPSVCERARHERGVEWLAIEGVDEDSDGIIDHARFP